MENIENSPLEHLSKTDSPESTTPPQTVTSFFTKLKTKWLKGTLLAVGGLFFLAIIIYAAYSHGKRGQEVQTALRPTYLTATAVLPPTTTLTPTQLPSEVNPNFVRYTNPKYNYSISYSANPNLKAISCNRYGITPLTGDERYIIFKAPSESSAESGCLSQGKNHAIVIIVQESLLTCPTSSSGWTGAESTVQLAGVDAVKCQERFIGERVLPGPDEVIWVAIPHEDRYVIVSLLDTNYRDTSDEILSTFKFHDEDQAKDWKTYTNNEMNYSLRYPENFSLQEFPKTTVPNLPTVIVRLEHNKIQDYPSIDLTVAKTDMSVERWIESNNYCPDTFDSCTAMVSGPILDSIQFQSINRHYGGINTLVKKGDIVFNFALGIKKPNQPPEQSESQLYNQILQTFEFLVRM